MHRTTYCTFETPLGWCGIAWRDPDQPGGPMPVVHFQLPEASRVATVARIARQTGGDEGAEPPPAIAATIQRIRRHLAGESQDLRDVPIALDGIEPFARRVYEAIRQIPPGDTRTYGEVARSLDHPGAARAVGQALGKNPIALIVPCHRVVAAGGKPGGFSAHGGAVTKARILELEKGSR